MDWLLGLLALTATVGLTAWGVWFFSRPSAHSHMAVTLGSTEGNPAGYSVWCFERGGWNLTEDRSAAGCAPGSPPTEPGLFDGYCVRVTSIQRPRG
jgi:hypothetical protein